MSILALVLLVVVVCVVLWAAKALMAAFSVGDPIRTVIYVVLVLVLLFAVLHALGLTSAWNLRL